MGESLAKAILKLVIFVSVVGCLQAGFLILVLNQEDTIGLLLKIYIPLFLLTLIIFSAVQFVKKKDPTKMGFAYLVGSIIKMLASLTYLLPDLLNKTETTTNYALNFVVAFFILMFYEVYVVVIELKKLQNKEL